MSELTGTLTWIRARRHELAARHADGRDERGATAVEWLLIIIAAVGICAAVALAVKTYVDTQSGKLNAG
jgi:Flp pilus assembly pilin Flp